MYEMQFAFHSREKTTNNSDKYIICVYKIDLSKIEGSWEWRCVCEEISFIKKATAVGRWS